MVSWDLTPGFAEHASKSVAEDCCGVFFGDQEGDLCFVTRGGVGK